VAGKERRIIVSDRIFRIVFVRTGGEGREGREGERGVTHLIIAFITSCDKINAFVSVFGSIAAARMISPTLVAP
jgi:hypothetical protein